MKRRSLMFLLAGTLIPSAAVGLAFAAPPPEVSAVAHVAGAGLADDVKVNADGIKFQTKRPSEVTTLTLTFDPGATTGWHSHPGLAVIAVTEGTGTLHFSDCSAESIGAGEAFVEAGDDPPTAFTNETSSPVVLTVTFIAPRGADVSRAEPAPTCG